MPSAASSNFGVYRASRTARTNLFASTSAVRWDGDPPKLVDHYDAAPGPDRLSDEFERAFLAFGGRRVPVTLMMHGFNMGRESFERDVPADADPVRYAPGAAGAGGTGGTGGTGGRGEGSGRAPKCCWDGETADAADLNSAGS